MPFDLFSGDLPSVIPSTLYEAIVDFLRTDGPRENRPREGYRLDYKSEWGDKALKTVAAFANTFGGVVIVGVSEDGGYPEEIVGVKERAELKTRLASAIASNLHPCPFFEIAECLLPSNESLKLAVIRVHEAPEVCLVTKKALGANPIYVRVEDKSDPADAGQVSVLLERKEQRRQADRNAQPVDLTKLTTWFYVCCQTLDQQSMATILTRSDTYFVVIARPSSRPKARVDLDFDRDFLDAIFTSFPGLSRRLTFHTEITRDSTSCEIIGMDFEMDYQMRWRAMSDGDVSFVTQIRDGTHRQEWSLYDLTAHSVYFLRALRTFWSKVNFYGTATLAAGLNVANLDLSNDQGFRPIFYAKDQTGVPVNLNTEILLPIDKSKRKSMSQGFLTTGYVGISEHLLSDSVGVLLNQLFRGLGYGVRFEALRKAVSDF